MGYKGRVYPSLIEMITFMNDAFISRENIIGMGFDAASSVYWIVYVEGT